jgi:hypothetical protein
MGLAFYALYYLCNGIWSYLLSAMLQHGLVLTLSPLAGP